MIKNSLFIYSIFYAILFGVKSLPVADNHIWPTYLDINELNTDGFDDIQLNLAKGNNPFQDDEVALEIVKGVNCEKTSVIIKRNKMLVDKSTTIWYGENTYTGFGDISYEKSTIDQTPEGFPDFSMFQNYDEKIALVAFGNDTDWFWEGFIGNSFIQHVSGNLYVLLDVSFPSPQILSEIKKIKNDNNCDGTRRPIHLSAKRSWIIPEILVALDWKSVENKTPIDVIKEVIVYYNAVDMLFSAFTSPTIQLNIAGIVIPMDSKSSPYFKKKSCQIEEEYYSNECISFSPVLDNLIKHFRKYNDIFLTKDYDVIMGMTRLPLCDHNEVCEYYGTSFESGTCENVDDDVYPPITGAVRHPHFRGNYFLAAREIGHILGGQYIAKWAHACYGGVMSEVDNYQDLYQSKLNWSTCAARQMSFHVRKRDNYMKCMWNVPKVFQKQETPTTTEMTTIETTIITTTETMTTVPVDDTTTISSTDISSDNNSGSNIFDFWSECETSSASTETMTTNGTTSINATVTPVASTTKIISTTTPDNSTTTTSSTTPAVTMTSTEVPSVTKKIVSSPKKSQSSEKIHTSDPITLIVVKGNTDGNENFLFKRPKNLKAMLGNMVDNIYYFVNKIIRKDD